MYSGFENISQYITVGYQPFSAPYSGWYFITNNTGANSGTPFIRIGIANVGGYMYSINGVPGSYKNVTSPVMYIPKDTQMIAQGGDGESALYVKKDES